MLQVPESALYVLVPVRTSKIRVRKPLIYRKACTFDEKKKREVQKSFLPVHYTYYKCIFDSYHDA